METLYRCAGKDCGGRSFNLTVVPYIAGFGGNEGGQRYLAARTGKDHAVAYVSLYVVKNSSVGGPTRDRVYARLIVVEIESMTTRLVVVDADEMQEQISKSGHVALYGILFDSGKATLKAESKATLDEIGALLKADGSLRLLIVGHTDTEGAYDFNLDLSQRRAQAVVASLIESYGIERERLFPVGVSFASPVATNDTEEGRAKNRRVELVKF